MSEHRRLRLVVRVLAVTGLVTLGLVACDNGSTVTGDAGSDDSISMSPSNASFQWVPYTDGSKLEGQIDLKNVSQQTKYYGIQVLFIGSDGKIVTDANETTSDIPAGMTETVSLSAPVVYEYPPEGWKYRVYGEDLSESAPQTLLASGTVTVDYGPGN